VVGFVLFLSLSSGCAALTNPIADGIPVRRLPPELLAKPKDPEQSIPLNLLGVARPDTYRLGPHDVLGVWIEGVLGEKTLAIPIQYPPPTISGQRVLAGIPAAGYPVPVQEDGKITLPFIDPVFVQGMSVAEARKAIRQALIDQKILAEGKDRVLVDLMQPRYYQVVVIRQESPAFTLGPQGAQGLTSTTRRGTGHVVELPAYENDLLHALAQTGGLPALDDYNEVIIYRNVRVHGDSKALARQLENLAGKAAATQLAGLGAEAIHVPLRTPAGEPFPLKPEDVVLHSGDVVYLEARDKDVFYTGGLLPSGEHVLPRDRDLNVVEALAQVRGPLLNGAYGTNTLAGNLIQPGIGQPSPNLLVVLRPVAGAGQVPIRIDLNRALQDSRERILVKAGDVLILQETPSYALARFASQTLVNFNIAVPVRQNGFFTGALDFFIPNQLPFQNIFSNFTAVPPGGGR